MNLKPELLGKCGFYCGTCPTYINGNCNGCIEEHMEGDCFTRDCVIEKGIDACGLCAKLQVVFLSKMIYNQCIRILFFSTWSWHSPYNPK